MIGNILRIGLVSEVFLISLETVLNTNSTLIKDKISSTIWLIVYKYNGEIYTQYVFRIVAFAERW